MSVQIAATVTLFALMFSLGLSERFHQFLSVWKEPATLLRSLFAVVVLVPLTVLALLWLFDLPPAVGTGLALLAAAPGAPMTTQRAKLAGGNLSYASSLQLTLAFLAVVITPVTLVVFYALFDLTIEPIGAIDVATQVVQVTFIPVIIGQLVLHLAPRFAEKIKKPVALLANALLVLLVVAVLYVLFSTPELRASMRLGPPSMAAIVIMVVSALTIGHLVGAPQAEQRGALATASVARNFGLALFIAGLTPDGKASSMTLVVYLLIGVMIATPYALWNRRHVEATPGS